MITVSLSLVQLNTNNYESKGGLYRELSNGSDKDRLNKKERYHDVY